MLADRLSSLLTSRACPPTEAAISSVSPHGPTAFTEPPPRSHSRTSSVLPEWAANMMLWSMIACIAGGRVGGAAAGWRRSSRAETIEQKMSAIRPRLSVGSAMFMDETVSYLRSEVSMRWTMRAHLSPDQQQGCVTGHMQAPDASGGRA
eukprot:2331799-Prymnesium_polylepis.1